MTDRIRTRFLIVGSGVAGLHTAWRASQTDDVLVVTKRSLFDSATAYAQGGIAAALGAGDSPELHRKDTLAAGAALCDAAAVAGARRGRTGARSRAADRRRALRPRLRRQAQARKGSRALAPSHRARARRSDRRRSRAHAERARAGERARRRVREGARARSHRRSRAMLRRARERRRARRSRSSPTRPCSRPAAAARSIATRRIRSSRPATATRSRIAPACKLADMEFVQFHPTALDTPENPLALISEAVRGEGAVLLNADGERFMSERHRLAELAPRDVVARAIFREQAGGRKVFLDARKLGIRLQEAIPGHLRAVQGARHRSIAAADPGHAGRALHDGRRRGRPGGPLVARATLRVRRGLAHRRARREPARVELAARGARVRRARRARSRADARSSTRCRESRAGACRRSPIAAPRRWPPTRFAS